MNKKIYIAGLMSLALLTGAAQGMANEHGGMMMHGKKDALAGVFFMKAHCILENSDKLALTEEQVKSIWDLKMDVKKTAIRQQADAQIADVDIFSAMKQDKTDADALQALVDEKYEGEKAQAKTIAKAYLKLKETLTAEQWQTLTSLEKEKRMEWAKAGGKGKNGGEHHSY